MSMPHPVSLLPQSNIASPLTTIVRKIIAEDKGSVADVTSHFHNAFSNAADIQRVPLLTASSIKNLANGSLVRFRCMVQDNSFNTQEYFHSIVLRKQSGAGEATGEQLETFSTAFRDTLPERDGWSAVEPDMRAFKPEMIGEKHPVFAVSIPGETAWVKDACAGGLVQDAADAVSAMSLTGDDEAISRIPPPIMDPRLRAKFPTVDADAVGALVKTYGKDPQLRLNEAIEVIGILEYVPAPSTSYEPTAETPNAYDLPPDTAEQAFFNTVPRLHAVFHRQLSLVDLNPAAADDAKEIETEIEVARADVHALLANVLMGDALAAEYVLLHLLSRIDHRAPHDTPIGYFPLNLGNVPPQATFANDLFDVLSQLLPRCQRISLTLKSLNEERYVSPAQNRDAALDVGLAAGDLQLVGGTWVLVEEAGLEDGTLNERGVGNISNLGKLIRTAKLPYLIPYGEMDREVDYGVLVLSQGKCMFG
ncbi:hypothetical protein HKX48_002501, partial [Thoreauomyces humboldtii]